MSTKKSIQDSINYHTGTTQERYPAMIMNSCENANSIYTYGSARLQIISFLNSD